MTAMSTNESTDPVVLLHHQHHHNNIATTAVAASLSSSSSSSLNNIANNSSSLGSSSSTSSQEIISPMNNNTIHNKTTNKNTNTNIDTPNNTTNNTAISTDKTHSLETTAAAASSVYSPQRSSLAHDPNLTPIASAAQRNTSTNRTIKRGNSQRTGGAATGTETTNASSYTPNNNTASNNTNMMMSITPQQLQQHSEKTLVAGDSTGTDCYTTTPLRSPDYRTSTPLSNLHGVVAMQAIPRHSSSILNNTHDPYSAAAAEHANGFHNHHSTTEAQVDALFSPVAQFLHDHGVHGTTTVHEHPAHNGDDTLHNHTVWNDEDDEHHEDDGSMTRPDDSCDDDEDDEDDDRFNPWLFISALPPYETAISGRSPVPLLPPLLVDPLPQFSSNVNDTPNKQQQQRKKKTLVLDLDETLVHCKVEPVPNCDFVFAVPFCGQTYQVHVQCRPYLQEFLQAVSPHFEVVVFTASQRVYAEALLDILDPGTCILLHERFPTGSILLEKNSRIQSNTILSQSLQKAN